MCKNGPYLYLTCDKVYVDLSSVQFSSMYICIAHPPMSVMRYSTGSTSVSIYKINKSIGV